LGYPCPSGIRPSIKNTATVLSTICVYVPSVRILFLPIFARDGIYADIAGAIYLSMGSQHKHIHVQAPSLGYPCPSGIRPSMAKKKGS